MSFLRSAEGRFALEVASLAHWTSSCCIFFDHIISKEHFCTTTFAGKTILSEDRIFYTSTKQVGWVWDMIRMKKVLPLLQSSFLRLSSSSIQICFSEVIAACIMASSFGSEMGGCILLRLRPHQGRWKLNHEERFDSEGKACSGGSSSKRVDVESLHKKVVFQKRKFCGNCSSSEDRRYNMMKAFVQKTRITLLGMKAKTWKPYASKLGLWGWNKCDSTRNSVSCSDLISEFQSSFSEEL